MNRWILFFALFGWAIWVPGSKDTWAKKSIPRSRSKKSTKKGANHLKAKQAFVHKKGVKGTSQKTLPKPLRQNIRMYKLPKDLHKTNRRIDLKQLLSTAKRYNPTLLALKKRVTVFHHKVKQVGNWSDLRVGVQGSSFPLPTFDPSMTPMTGIQYSVSQKIPLGSKLALRKEVAKRDVELYRTYISESWLGIAYQIRYVVHELYFLKRSWTFQKELMLLAKQVEAVARTKYTTGKTQQKDFLHALNLQASLRLKMTQILGKDRQLRILLLRLTGGKNTQVWGVPSLYSIKMPAPQKDLLKYAMKKRGRAEFWRIRARKAGQLGALANALYWPDITVSLAFRQRFQNQMDQGIPFLSLGVKIPIPTWQNPRRRGLLKGARAQKQLASARLKELRMNFRQQIATLLEKSKALEGREALLHTQLLPLAQKTFQSTLNNYKFGKEDFVNVIRHLERLFQLRESKTRLFVHRLHNRSKLLAVVGGS